MAAEVEDWQRLDPRKLLLDPIKVLGQAVVPLIAVVVGLSSSGNSKWLLLGTPVLIVGALVLGAVPWLTTYYRMDDRQFQLRTGLLNKKTSTANLDRIRSVDLEASLLHRVLGLRKVEIGTGVDDERITLDAVSTGQAADLRALLLDRKAATPPATEGGGQIDPDGEPHPTQPPAPEQELAVLDLSWVRFAPFSLARLVIVAGFVGFLSQFADDLPFLDQEHLTDFWRWVTGFAIALILAVVFVAGLLGWLVIAVAGYLAQWWGLRLTRQHGSLHLTSGLFTTRSVSVEEKRIRGVELKEPVLLRLVGGAELATLSTGVADGVTGILPPCPRGVATAVGGDVLDEPAPLAVPMQQHGPAARRRAHVRSQYLTLVLALAAVALQVVGPVERATEWLPGWIPLALVLVSAVLAALVAESAYAHLGHALTRGHLVAGSGLTTRTRTVLEHDGVIGWVVSQSLFQRRAGLATLIATTAAGNERVVVRDVPHDRALAVAHAVTPEPLRPFLA